MIRSFLDKRTEQIFHREPVKRLSRALQSAAHRKLLVLNAAQSLVDLAAVPGNRLKALMGDRKGQYSIRVNDQWRICFAWQEGDAHFVELADYH